MVGLLTLAAFLGAGLSAVAGLGGGTFLIAVMFAVGLLPAVAIPLHAAVQLVSNGSRTLAYWRHVNWPAVGWFSLSCLPLPFVTVAWVSRANPDVIRLVLALAILISLLPRPQAWRPHWSIKYKMLLAGALNGAVGMLIGATGLVIGPFFLDRRWGKETTVATLAACQSVGHGLKIVAFGALGAGLLQHWSLAWPLMLAVAAGTLLGRLLMQAVSQQQFALLFRGVLIVLALRLVWVGLKGLA